ncbi:hypothetical protein N7493_011413 [Penicillium malachiteum]|uniref:FAD-binding FR-type domain-containing protein n=1 Tax=Penicillium malachiteum TaxID=1324776 RepID=A0AAD6HC27_9EURO|nr:hypothetical protein N7493_011413 [Penicillium malachiteum]
MLRLGWLLVALGASCAWGDYLPVDERCVTAIYSAYNYITFSGTPATGMWDTRCQNPLKVASIYAASEVYCQDADGAAGLAQMAAGCEEYGHRQLLPREAVAENLTRDALRAMRVVHYLELTRSDVMDTPIMISPSYFQQVYATIASWQFETWSHHAFGYIGYAYWGALILLGVGYRLCHCFIYYRKAGPRQEIESQIYHDSTRKAWVENLPLVGNIAQWIQTHLLVASPINRGREVFSCTFSNRAEAFAVAGFWIISIVLSVIGYRTFLGNIYWPEITDQLLRYSADRTGIMSFANLPLLWLFGGRNNILIWATGWSFATFNVFHRHVARVATIQAIAHTFLYFIIYFRANKLWKVFYKVYILWGLLAVILMVLLLVASVDQIRFGSYELFLIIHIFLSILTLIGCFYHTIVFEGHEYWKYLWPSVIVWVFDRFLRLVRLCYCNIHVKITGRDIIRTSSARMTYDEATDVVRLEVLPATPFLRPTPGDYFFLYQPFRWTGWESHPFTVGTWEYQADSKSSSLTREPNESVDISHMPLLRNVFSQPDEMTAAETLAPEIYSSRLKAIFWIRPYDGWTRQLRQQCLESKDHPVETTILLEGPYGHQFPIWEYESVLMIMGGTGIASAVPYLQDHLRRSGEEWDETAREKTRTRDIELIWTAKQPAFLRELASQELKPLMTRDDFQASFYATGASDISEGDQDQLTFDIKSGRPHLQSLIMSRASDASSSGVSLVVLVCGPASMADEARAATYLAMRQGYGSIKYVEESFAW